MAHPTAESTGLQFACSRADVPTDGTVHTCSVNGKTIAVARHTPGADSFVAFDTQCPHMNGPLRFGRVVQGEVICPWHFFRFDATTGQASACDKTQMRLATYAAQAVDDKVYVKLA